MNRSLAAVLALLTGPLAMTGNSVGPGGHRAGGRRPAGSRGGGGARPARPSAARPSAAQGRRGVRRRRRDDHRRRQERAVLPHRPGRPARGGPAELRPSDLGARRHGADRGSPRRPPAPARGVLELAPGAGRRQERGGRLVHEGPDLPRPREALQGRQRRRRDPGGQCRLDHQFDARGGLRGAGDHQGPGLSAEGWRAAHRLRHGDHREVRRPGPGRQRRRKGLWRLLGAAGQARPPDLRLQPARP
jgi:hypothetical protein